MRGLLFAAFGGIVLISSICCANDSTRTCTSVLDVLGNDLAVSGQDALSFFSAPLQFTGTEWLYAGSFAAGTLLLMAMDDELQRRVGRETVLSLNNDIWDIPTRYGVVTYANLFSGAVYLTGLLTYDDLRVTGRLLLESLTFSGVAVVIARYIFARSRPYAHDGPWKFNGFTWDNEIQAFPSGHTTVAFAMSTVLAERIDNLWSRIVFYGMASLTAYSRVVNNQHWFSDVVVGAALGLGAGLHVIGMGKRHESYSPAQEGRLMVYPSTHGIRIAYRID